MNYHRVETLQTMMDAGTAEFIAEERAYWQNFTRDDVEKAASKVLPLSPSIINSRAYLMSPDGETDETKSVALYAPLHKGWTADLYMRAKITQRYVAPNSRFFVFPSNTFGQKHYDLSYMAKNQAQRFEDHGDIYPLGELDMRTLERISDVFDLGDVALSGFSFGGKRAITTALVGSDKINITNLNADEVPSKSGRGLVPLLKDFMDSGKEFPDAVKDTGIPALSEIFNGKGKFLDMAKFGGMLVTPTGLQTEKALRDDITLDLVGLSTNMSLEGKLGWVQGSTIFDPNTLNRLNGNTLDGFDLVEYQGEGFRKHASGDSLFVNAMMVRDGLRGFVKAN